MADNALESAKKQVQQSQRGVPMIESFFDTVTNTVSYVVRDPATNKAAIVDSVLDFDPAAGRTDTGSADTIIKYVKDNGLDVEWLLETHAHADHLSAAPYLQEKLGGKIAIGEHITTVQEVFGKLFNAGSKFQRDGSDFDALWKDGDRFQIGELDVTVLHVPGHTPACVAYIIGDAVFVGDTMFMPDYGTARCDFPGGDARTLYRSLNRLLSLPSSTRLLMCHDYLPEGRDDYVWETTVGEQKAKNVHAHEGVSEDEFVAMREGRDKTLSMPTLILPSVQVNMRAGHMPPADDNDVRYLKIPLNAI
jgi:glyoxylase-like metal-dependent hydrolase (beta-lactamase superfamily II)